MDAVLQLEDEFELFHAELQLSLEINKMSVWFQQNTYHGFMSFFVDDPVYLYFKCSPHLPMGAGATVIMTIIVCDLLCTKICGIILEPLLFSAFSSGFFSCIISNYPSKIWQSCVLMRQIRVVYCKRYYTEFIICKSIQQLK